MKLESWIQKGKPLNTIINEDCIKGLKQIEDNSINLIVTSSPYNVGFKYDNWDDDKPQEEYLEWTEKWLRECYRVLKDDGRIAVNHCLRTGRNGSRFPIMDIRNIQERIGFKVNSLAVWADPTLAKLSAWGSWLSASAPYIQTPYEGILMSCKKQWKRLDSGTSTLTKEEFIESVGGIWKIQPETKQFTICNFPIELPRRCINLLSYENDIVLDPFMGSGTTACACLITKRNYIGFEISSNYTRIAEYRLKDYDKECGLKDLYEGE